MVNFGANVDVAVSMIQTGKAREDPGKRASSRPQAEFQRKDRGRSWEWQVRRFGAIARVHVVDVRRLHLSVAVLGDLQSPPRLWRPALLHEHIDGAQRSVLLGRVRL